MVKMKTGHVSMSRHEIPKSAHWVMSIASTVLQSKSSMKGNEAMPVCAG